MGPRFPGLLLLKAWKLQGPSRGLWYEEFQPWDWPVVKIPNFYAVAGGILLGISLLLPAELCDFGWKIFHMFWLSPSHYLQLPGVLLRHL